MSTIIGIAPGKEGGVAWQVEGAVGCRRKVGCCKMPVTAADLVIVLESLGTNVQVVVEAIGAGISGRRGVKGVRSLNLSYGTILGALAGLHAPHETVAAGVWQRSFGLLRKSKTETDTEKKNRHKAKAQQLFPALAIFYATADALLIAEWLRRRELGGGNA